MQEISDGEKKNVQQMIEAFSEYMVAVNSEYSYNKTYLIAYVEDFIQCQKVLKLKYQILLNEILPKLGTAGIGQGYVINIDHAWKVEKGKVKLNNTFNPDIVKNHGKNNIKNIHQLRMIIIKSSTKMGNTNGR